jgi:hypothetical protein
VVDCPTICVMSEVLLVFFDDLSNKREITKKKIRDEE